MAAFAIADLPLIVSALQQRKLQQPKCNSRSATAEVVSGLWGALTIQGASQKQLASADSYVFYVKRK